MDERGNTCELIDSKLDQVKIYIHTYTHTHTYTYKKQTITHSQITQYETKSGPPNPTHPPGQKIEKNIGYRKKYSVTMHFTSISTPVDDSFET